MQVERLRLREGRHSTSEEHSLIFYESGGLLQGEKHAGGWVQPAPGTLVGPSPPMMEQSRMRRLGEGTVPNSLRISPTSVFLFPAVISRQTQEKFTNPRGPEGGAWKELERDRDRDGAVGGCLPRTALFCHIPINKRPQRVEPLPSSHSLPINPESEQQTLEQG